MARPITFAPDALADTSIAEKSLVPSGALAVPSTRPPAALINSSVLACRDKPIS